MQCAPRCGHARVANGRSDIVGGSVKRVVAFGALCCAAALGLVGTPATPARAEAGTDAARRILHDGFDRGSFAQEGGLFYKNNPEQRAGRVIFGDAVPYRGIGILTLIAMPSCLPQSIECSERAEVWERPEVLAPYDSTVWYGFALRLNDPLPQDDRRYVIAQWKREILPGAAGDYSPFLALRLYRGRLGITVETDRIRSYPIGGDARPGGCLPGEALVLDRPDTRQTRALVAVESGTTREDYPSYFNACAPGIQVTTHAELPSAQKGWIDFVIRSQPGPDGDGHIEVIADGTRIVTVQGHIGHSGPGLDDNQYFKMGPYRAPSSLPWSISYGDFRRGPRCSDVIRLGQCPPDVSKAIGKPALSTSSDARKGEEP